MFWNSLSLAFKRLIKDRLYSIVNIAGIAIGFTVVILIGLFLLYELSYDRWIPEHGNIYKIEFTETEPGHEPLTSAMTPDLLASALVKDYSSIESAVRLKQTPFTIARGNDQFNETVSFVDKNFFNIFDIGIVNGDPANILKSNSGIAISQRMADKYFGDNTAVGEVLNLNGRIDQVVTAVFNDLPMNSHFDMNFIVAIDPTRFGNNFLPKKWGSDSVHTYIKTADNFDPTILQKNGSAFAERNISLTWTKLPPADLHHYNAIPIADIHLYSKMENHEKPTSEIKTVITFAIIAVLILVLAGVNFTNLSIAQAMKRAKEVGMRKVLGANRRQLITQFLGEALLTTVIGFLIGLTIAEIVLPYYSSFLDRDLSFYVLGDPSTVIAIFAAVTVTGLGGGIYPAFILSGFNPSVVLRSNKSSFKGKPWFRNSLVIMQFSVSIALMAATMIMYYQVDYVKSTDLGFKPAGKVSIPIWQIGVSAKVNSFKDQLVRVTGVKSVAMSTTELPRNDGGLAVFIPPNAGRDDARSISVITTDTRFFNLLEQKPIAGRLFDDAHLADFLSKPNTTNDPLTRGVMVNETAVKALGFETATQAIGQNLITPGNTQNINATIVGVVPDAHLGSLYREIVPIVFYVSDQPLSYLLIEIDELDRLEAISNIRKIWQSNIPEVTMSTTYLEEAYNNIYLEADRQKSLFAIFSILALVVACLGLYGLAAHMAESRTKEIGVRKVLGAKIFDIIMLLNWQFTKLIFVAAPLGIVTSAWFMYEWLNGFAYRISLFGTSWVFPLAAFVAFTIAWITVTGHAYRVARTNPIYALQSE